MLHKKPAVTIDPDKVVAYIQEHPRATPTKIGLHLGLSYDRASSAMNGPLKKLVAAGKVLKLAAGKYMVKEGL